MPQVDAADASLINDVEFLDALDKFDPEPASASEAVPQATIEAPAGADPDEAIFDELEAGLDMLPGATAGRLPQMRRAPVDEPFAVPYESDEPPAPAQRIIPYRTAALVLVGCLTAGAATAAFVFQDRLTQISVSRATR